MNVLANIPQVKTSPEGTWTIASGKTTEGTSYSGTVQIYRMGQIHAVSWLTTVGDYPGLVLATDGYLFAGCSLEQDYGLMLYKINPDGTLNGQWTAAATKGKVGSEQASGGIPGQLQGSYDINGVDSRNKNYQGTLNILSTGETYKVTWSVGEQFEGIGLRIDDWLAVCWGYGKVFCLAYKLQNNQAKGRWARPDRLEVGEEVLEKIC
jgi:hypothetical protein